MNKTGIIAAISMVALACGCGKTEQQPAAKAPAAAARLERAQAPYYYGLVEEYKTILAEDPNNLAGNIALANAYFDSGQWKESIRYYERALKLDPQNADVITDMGTSYRNMGMTDRATALYHQAMTYEPAHQNARYNLGIVFAYDKKDYAAAIHIWEELLKMAPNHPQAGHMRTCLVNFKKQKKEVR